MGLARQSSEPTLDLQHTRLCQNEQMRGGTDDQRILRDDPLVHLFLCTFISYCVYLDHRYPYHAVSLARMKYILTCWSCNHNGESKGIFAQSQFQFLPCPVARTNFVCSNARIENQLRSMVPRLLHHTS
jgi:hypothetical protein